MPSFLFQGPPRAKNFRAAGAAAPKKICAASAALGHYPGRAQKFAPLARRLGFARNNLRVGVALAGQKKSRRWRGAWVLDIKNLRR